ncbi:MAG: sugar O-acetyltransferase [Eubacteriales bacterium]|jgi:maltose O-acetyltransferase
MTELEKLEAGLPYDFHDPEVDARKINAVVGCQKLASCDPSDSKSIRKILEGFLGGIGKDVNILPGFVCDCGKNIFIGDDFLANYNVTILDIAPVHIGDHVMIGPNTMISTVSHPLTPSGRRKHLGIAKPVTIGDDVWIGGNVTILPGVTIGSNVVVAAGAVVTKDVPDNTLVGGVPAKKMRTLENDIDPSDPE